MCLLIEDNDINNISLMGLVDVGLPTAILFATRPSKSSKLTSMPPKSRPSTTAGATFTSPAWPRCFAILFLKHPLKDQQY
jgi:hypothetical protein